MDKKIKHYLAKIGAKGGAAKSDAKTAANRENARKRAIDDEFTGITAETPERAAVLRYRARKAKKIAEIKETC